jgi:hypothetical protein
MKKGAPRQETSKWSTVCSTFSRSEWSTVRSALFAKEGTSKKRPSPHLHEVPTLSNKVSPRTLQTALLTICLILQLSMLLLQTPYRHHFTHAPFGLAYLNKLFALCVSRNSSVNKLSTRLGSRQRQGLFSSNPRPNRPGDHPV